MSIATTPSVTGVLAPRSTTVRNADVVGRPRRSTISSLLSAVRLTEAPARRRVPIDSGIVTSIGSQDITSKPCSQAAVQPENAAPAGNRLATALNNSCGLSLRPTQRYRPEPQSAIGGSTQLATRDTQETGLRQREGPSSQCGRHKVSCWHRTRVAAPANQ